MVTHNTARKRKALVIDDESDICYLLSSILQQKNIQVVFAGSLSETESILQSADNFGYIFLDNHLPDGLGSTYIEKIKNRFPETRLIMITAHDTNNDRRYAEQKGIDEFIGKPFSKEAILRTVDGARFL